MKKEIAANRENKSSLFHMLFSRKKELLELYNTLNHSHYTDESLLEFKTMDNVFYMNIKNDLSFLIDLRLNLYEHQSTCNLNMPLRDLFYVADQLHVMVHNRDLYSKKLVKIPTPEFIVFYNGEPDQPDRQVLRLSDAYMIPVEEAKLELIVTVLNINEGHNKDIMDKCKPLRDYAHYVQKVRDYSKEMGIDEAVDRAVRECMKEDVMREFLSKQRAEAIKVSIYEFDAELHERTLREEEREEGRVEGRQEERFTILDRILAKLDTNLQNACSLVGVSVEEYQNYKKDQIR